MGCLLSYSTLKAVSHELRAQGETVALTHGAFDLFNIGHASLLRQSKKLADYLIVGIESDQRINSYKSVSLPIIPLEYRIRVLLENKSVDFVFVIEDPLFEQTYYRNMYQELAPHIVTYGENFAAKDKINQDKKHVKGTAFREVRHVHDEVDSPVSITDIIDKVLSAESS